MLVRLRRVSVPVPASFAELMFGRAPRSGGVSVPSVLGPLGLSFGLSASSLVGGRVVALDRVAGLGSGVALLYAHDEVVLLYALGCRPLLYGVRCPIPGQPFLTV